MSPAPRPPLRLIDDDLDEGASRLADALFEGVPDHLLEPLRQWFHGFLVDQPGLETRVLLNLRITPPPANGATRLYGVSYLPTLEGTPLLQAINAALQPTKMSWSVDNGSWLIHEWSKQFEVVCPECGDNDGPFDQQPTEVRAVRGPHPDEHVGTRALRRHLGLS